MLHFSKDGGEGDLSEPIQRIRALSAKIEQKIGQREGKSGDEFIETLSVEELKDLRQVIMASEYLLTKYQDKVAIKAFLQDFVGIIMHAANSVNGMQGELEDLLISAEVALEHIHNLHYEVTQNLAFGRSEQTKMDDFRSSQTSAVAVPDQPTSHACEKPSSINLTNTARGINTSDYLERTAVEI